MALAEANRAHVTEDTREDTVAGILRVQTIRSLAGFITEGDHSGQYATSQPLNSPITAVLAAAGFLIAVLRFRETESRLVVLWAVLGLVLGSILIMDPPSATRLIMIFPVPFIFTALTLETLFGLMARVCSRQGFDVAVQDIEALGLRPVFAWVLCIGALEFVRDPARALASFADCLAPSGMLVLLYPRRGLLWTLYALYHLNHGARIHLFSRAEMSALLVGAGFETPAHHHDCMLSTVCSTQLARGASR
jgi:Methyltransferase domain